MSRATLFLFLICSFFCLAASNERSYSNVTVWDVVRNQFSLNHHVSQPEVQRQIRWLIAHPGYLQELSHAEPYIYHIVTEIKKRNLPGELALIPMIESTYDPFAYSGKGAAGLWQLMPGTGSELGLKQDWWFDGRRSIRPSTDAALNYLDYLARFFEGDWILAIASYDAGEGRVSRAIKQSKQKKSNAHFWSLPLPSETKAYVPRLLALAEIINYPEHYHVRLPEILHRPYFEEVHVENSIDLTRAAKLAEMPYRDFIKLNPGFNRASTAPNQPFKLLIPTKKVATFHKNLSQISDKRGGFREIEIIKKETVASVAKRYFTTPQLIRQLNNLKSEELKPHQKILLPDIRETPKTTQTKKSLPKPKNYKIVHILQHGETLQTLGKKYSVSENQIRSWNHLKKNQHLALGTELILWRNG